MVSPRGVVALLAILVGIAGVPSRVWADRAITGVVVDDATGEPVVGAMVAIGVHETATDDQGHDRSSVASRYDRDPHAARCRQ